MPFFNSISFYVLDETDPISIGYTGGIDYLIVLQLGNNLYFYNVFLFFPNIYVVIQLFSKYEIKSNS